jgi:hypothetical protein
LVVQPLAENALIHHVASLPEIGTYITVIELLSPVINISVPYIPGDPPDGEQKG